MSELRTVPHLSSGLNVEDRLQRIAAQAASLWMVPASLGPASREGRAFQAALDRSARAGVIEGGWIVVAAAARVITHCRAQDRASVALRGVHTVKQALDAGADPLAIEAAISLGVAITEAVHWPDYIDTEAAFAAARSRLRDDRASRALGGPKAAANRVKKWQPWATNERKAYLSRHPGKNNSDVARHLDASIERARDAGLVSTVVGFHTLYEWARRQKD